MTPEERIAQLERDLAEERAERRRLASIVEQMVLAQIAREQSEQSARATRRARNLRHRSGDVSDAVSCASHETSHSPSPSLPPPSSSPSLSAPISPPPISSPNPSSPPSASQAPVDAAPFTLEVQEKKPRKREKSDAEKLYADLEDSRRQRCEEVGETFIAEGWAPARQNSQLGPLLKAPEEERSRLASAWSLYLADDGQRARTPAWSLGFFLTVRARYETLAAREDAA